MALAAVAVVVPISGGCSPSKDQAQQPDSASADAASEAQPVETAPPTTPDSAPRTDPPPQTDPPDTVDNEHDYGDGITLATTCREFITEHDTAERYSAAIRMTLDFKVDSPGNPMWGMNMDSVCGSSQSMTLGEYFERAGRNNG